ncbi:MAG: DNA-directed RNA polymerase subunit omega [Eubacteriales bacterium]|nr:DNA-directed RNA polymerase subunit omega [Candidatus Hippenecus merdae]MCQ2414827.1 DNA-directed RNA polymerase subunit omega [Lachnospiraceae bacterium]MDO4808972.1 DNA-directed RNA polymerase subunit omega [Eubacteriales bacterium]
MLRPTYMELMDKANKDVKEGEEPVVKSRYSIVLAAAKRARQIIAGEQERIVTPDIKPLSLAVEELDSGKVTIENGGNGN